MKRVSWTHFGVGHDILVYVHGSYVHHNTGRFRSVSTSFENTAISLFHIPNELIHLTTTPLIKILFERSQNHTFSLIHCNSIININTMMTTAVNALAFRNLSIVCRNGTEAVGRITKSPYIISSTETKPFSAPRTVTPVRGPQQEVAAPAKSTASKKRTRTVVRFAPETASQEPNNERPRAKKRRRFEASDSEYWYSKGELRDIQKTCVSALHSHHRGIRTPATEAVISDGSLERFSPHNQKMRKMARTQAYETIKAVQAFEKATGTKAPPELLSMLLQRYSTSRVIEANYVALRTADACQRS